MSEEDIELRPSHFKLIRIPTKLRKLLSSWNWTTRPWN